MNDVQAVVPSIFVGIALFSGFLLVAPFRLSVGHGGRAATSIGVVATAAAFTVGWLVGAVVSGIPIFGLPTALIAAGIPSIVVARRRMEAQRRSRSAWPDALRLLNAHLLAGSPIHPAMLRLEADGPEVLAPFWSRYRRLAATGDSASALLAIKMDQDDPFTDRLIEVLVRAVDAGPAVAVELISELAQSVSEDLLLEMHIASSNMEQRINARVIGYLPTLALFLIGSSNEQYREYYQSSSGAVVVVIGSVLSLIGLLLVAILSRSPVENRLLTIGEPT